MSRKPSSKNAANSVGLNGSTRSPSVEVPSGKNISRWPARSRASNTAFCASASAPLRAMNTVPVARASQPMPGQPATSDLDTK
jgi:hypothetical protein